MTADGSDGVAKPMLLSSAAVALGLAEGGVAMGGCGAGGCCEGRGGGGRR